MYAATGLLQSVAAAVNDPFVFYTATSSSGLHVVDTRQKDNATVLKTDAAISSICVLPNGAVVSGDAKGVVKVWDMRQSVSVDDDAAGGPTAPVAHIAGLAGKHGSSAGGRYLAINYHDNVVRL
jgi:COMPASS component SWD3